MYIISIIVLLIIFLVVNLNVLQVSRYKIISNKIPNSFKGYKIMHLSDLHSKEFGKNNIRLLNKINEINPDVIFMTGDMIRKTDKNFMITYEFIKNLCKKYKIYYSLGNHEITHNYTILKNFIQNLERLGVIVLNNKKNIIEKDGEFINIYGLNFKHNMLPKRSLNYKKIMESILGEISKDKFNVLLAHDPLNFEIYNSWGADLIFSGHVHGGVIRIFGIGLLSPRRTLFPKYSSGKYKKGSSTMIVSRGLGNTKVGVRIFNLPNIVVVELDK